MKTKVILVESRFYEDIAAYLREGALGVLDAAENIAVETVAVEGALEIPLAVARIADAHGAGDAPSGGKPPGCKPPGFVALGCVIRGETGHYDIVAGESARALMEVGIRYHLAIGNGILTCESREQALARADPKQGNRGASAARACLGLLLDS